MRNLKRALSLVLAAMMLIGMMVVSAGAATKDFTDKAEIKHPEAVNTLVALNVISGKEDGSYFDPNGTLTRAEMAKLITYVLNGGVEPVLGTKVTPTYKDIKGHWAEAYIEYCTSMNIIVGDGTGKFNPEGTLTASQCAKMLLTAMNYKDDVFGFVGNSWEINVNREANAAGLYKELGSVSASDPISRDNAAQMVYNAIQSKTMKLSWSQDMTTGQITQNYTLTGNSLFVDKFGGQVWVGTFDGNKSTGAASTDGEIKVTGRLETANSGSTAAYFPSDLALSNIGEQVRVLFKDGTGGIADQPDKKDTIYGVYNTGSTQVLNTNCGLIGDQKSSDAKVVVDGTKYDTLNTVKVVTNYDVSNGVDKAANDGNSGANSALTTALKAANGNTIKFVFDSDGKIATAYVVTSKLATVTAVNSEKVTMNNGVGTIKIADNDVYSGIAKNDVVVVTTSYKTNAYDDGAYTVVEKAEVVSGTVNGFKGNETVTLDGTVYKIYGNAALTFTSIGGETGITAFGTTSIGETFNLYLVNGYVYGAVQTSEAASNYSLVLQVNGGTAGSTFDPLKVEVMAADGTKTILTVDKDSTGTLNEGDIVTWTGSAGKALVKIEADWATGTTSSSSFYSKTSKTLEGTVTDTDCVLFVQTADGKSVGASGSAYSAYNIRSLGNITTTGKDYKAVTKDGKVVAAVIDLAGKPSGATSTAIYGMVTADNGTIKVDDTYYTSYTLWTTDGEKTVNVKTGTLTKGTIYKYEPTADNNYDNATAFAGHGGTAVAIKNYNEADKLLTYYTTKDSTPAPNAVWSGETTKAVADDVVILYVDADADKAGEEIGVNAYDDITDLKNAIVITKGTTGDDANIISTIIIETSNKVDIA